MRREATAEVGRKSSPELTGTLPSELALSHVLQDGLHDVAEADAAGGPLTALLNLRETPCRLLAGYLARAQVPSSA